MNGVSLLGATGSIGRSTLDVIARHPERYRAVALTANSDVDGLFAQCRQFSPDFAAMADTASASRLEQRLRAANLKIEVGAGVEGLARAASLPQANQVMAAIVGAAGLLPALAAIRAGKRLLLANKEALVVAGRLFMQEAERYGVDILPIDSEHNAVFQCLPSDFGRGLEATGVKRILLTASGGPFRCAPVESLRDITPGQACAHPNWSMGRKISVDSATMMNKGLEVIEACWLFHTTPDRVQVVVHPQSVVHSMVEYTDGSVLAQMGQPDMRTPIAHALAWPDRIRSGVGSLDLFAVARLDFEPPDLARFPCLALAYRAIEQGGSAPTVLNAANEVAVAAFLEGGLGFTAIPEIVEATLEAAPDFPSDDLDELLDADRQARALAEQSVRSRV